MAVLDGEEELWLAKPSSRTTHTTTTGYALKTHNVLGNILTSHTDYSLSNPDTLTKYKTAGQISEKVLAEVSKLCVPGAKIVEVCQKGDKLMEEELAKVYRGKKVIKGTSLRLCGPPDDISEQD